jgi:hypothetical protein
MNHLSRRALSIVATVVLTIAGAQRAAAQGLEPIAYAIRIPAPGTHEIVVQATVPASGRASLDLMMPTWSPGYYRVEDYAANVHDVSAATLDGQPLAVEKTNGNHWRVDTRGPRFVKLSYRVFCNQRTVTTNWDGLRFVTSASRREPWTLERQPDQTAEQRQHLANWLRQ